MRTSRVLVCASACGLVLLPFLFNFTQASTGKSAFVTKDAPKAGIVAKIGNDEITEEELIGEAKADLFELKKQEFDLKTQRLNQLVMERLVGAEARKVNLSFDEFVAQKIVKGAIEVSDQEFKQFVKEKRIPKEQINPQLTSRINSFIQGQKHKALIDGYVAKLTKSTPVEVYFAKPRLDVKVELGRAPTFGKESAVVKIVEFSDFQCPFCGQAANIVTELKKKYGNKIQFAFKHFPLPMHQQAFPAAEASMCVNEQGAEKFWKFHDLAFKDPSKLDASNLKSFAKQSGADLAKFENCVATGKFKELVRDDMNQGQRIGVRSTPTFFVGGQLVAGALPIEEFSKIIDEELTLAKK